MQKKYKVQYEFVNERSKIGIKKYVILDPSKKYSMISSKRLEKDGIYITDIKELSIKPVDFTEDMKTKIIIATLELNLLIGKEKLEKKILVYVSEEFNEFFYLGNDFLSYYSIKEEEDNITKYSLRQEEIKIEIEEDIPYITNAVNEEDISDLINEDDTSNEREVSFFIRNRWLDSLLYLIIPLIIAIFAIIVFNYRSSFTSDLSDEFIKYAEEFGYGPDSSNESMKRNCTILDNIIDQKVTFKEQLVVMDVEVQLNEFYKELGIVKSSCTEMYSNGIWFFWIFEQSIKNILNYISNKSLITSIQRKIDDKEKIYLLKSIEDSIEALRAFDSSVEKAYKATFVAETFRNSTQYQVIKAKEEVQKFIYNSNNPSSLDKTLNYIYTTFNMDMFDIKIATETEISLENIDKNLEGIAEILLDFKENLDKHLHMLPRLSASIESLEQIRWNRYEIKKAGKLLSAIKESHKKF